MPDADKHRQYRIFAPSLLALLLACLIVTSGIATSNLPVRGRIDLEHNTKLNSLGLHGSRQELRSDSSQSGPGINAVDGPEHVAGMWREAPNLVPGSKHIASVRLANETLPPPRDRVLSSRAPPPVEV